MNKKQIRKEFRIAVFERDGYCCRACGKPGQDRQAIKIIEGLGFLDAHHIIDRSEMPNGGYVLENGISLCGACHIKAESFHLTGESVPGFAPEDLFEMIGSSLEAAIKASEELLLN